MQESINLVVFVLVSIFSELKRAVQKVYPSSKELLLICFQNLTSHEMENDIDIFIAGVFRM